MTCSPMFYLLSLSLWTFVGLVVLVLVVARWLRDAGRSSVDDLSDVWYDGSHTLNSRLVQDLQSVTKAYNARRWLFCGMVIKFPIIHSVATMLKPDLGLKYERESLLAPDGLYLTIDWLQTKSQRRPIVLVIPGITGHSRSNYLQHLVRLLHSSNYRVAAMNHPGIHEGDMLVKPRYMAAHDSRDIETIVNHIHKCYPKAPMLVFAYSLGACMLVNYLGKVGMKTPVIGAISVSNPWDIPATLNKITNCFWRFQIFNRHFTSVLKDMFFRNKKILMDAFPHIQEEKISKGNDLHNFMNHATIKIFGYGSVEEYYDHCSCLVSIPKVAIPLMVIHALDDPIVCEKNFPWKDLKQNPHIILITTKHGGHSGWLEGVNPFNQEAWIDRIAVQWVGSIVKHTKKLKTVCLL